MSVIPNYISLIYLSQSEKSYFKLLNSSETAEQCTHVLSVTCNLCDKRNYDVGKENYM